jgi:hypothetical protein
LVYVVKLKPEENKMYRAIYDEGFSLTDDLDKATKFSTSQEAENILNLKVIQSRYTEAKVERIK